MVVDCLHIRVLGKREQEAVFDHTGNNLKMDFYMETCYIFVEQKNGRRNIARAREFL